jgi:hypothetical protein
VLTLECGEGCDADVVLSGLKADDRCCRTPVPRCSITLGIPAAGFGAQLIEMHAWLDEHCGADGWAMTLAGLRGVINDAVAIYFLDAALAAAFVSRWCAGSKVEISEGAFRVREDRTAPRAQARPHKTF